MTTATYLNDLITAKNDIKAALIDKGCTPAGGLTTYADAINKIPSISDNRYINLKFKWSAFTHAPIINTDNYTTMSYMFADCSDLITVGVYNAGNVKNADNMFDYCYNLQNIGGLTDLGKQPDFDCQTTNLHLYMFQHCNNLSVDAIQNIINGLYDRATANYDMITLYVPQYIISQLPNDIIAIATNKGWSIAA